MPKRKNIYSVDEKNKNENGATYKKYHIIIGIIYYILATPIIVVKRIGKPMTVIIIAAFHLVRKQTVSGCS